MGDAPALDPEAGRAARVVARDVVDPVAHELGDEEPLAHLGQQRLEAAAAARRDEDVVHAARVARGLHAEAAGGVGVEDVAAQHAARDQIARARGHALGVEGGAAECLGDVRVLADGHPLREDPLAEAIQQEGGAAVEAPAADGAEEVADQAAGDLRGVEHGALACGDLAPAEAAHGALAGAPPHGLGRLELGRVARHRPPVVPLHGLALARDHGAAHAVARGLVAAEEAMGVAVHRGPLVGGDGGALGVGDAPVHGARGVLAGRGQRDRALGVEPPRVVEVELGPLAREPLRWRQPRAGVLARVACDGERGLHRRAHRVLAQVRGAGAALAPAHVHRDTDALVAVELHGLHLPQAHRRREPPVDAGRGLGGIGAAGTRRLQGQRHQPLAARALGAQVRRGPRLGLRRHPCRLLRPACRRR